MPSTPQGGPSGEPSGNAPREQPANASSGQPGVGTG